MDDSSITNQLYERYRNPTSNFFLVKNVNELYKSAKRDAKLQPVNYSDILNFKHSLESLSREKEQRILKWRKKYLSYRKWVSWAPNCIWLADLCFLRPIKHLNKRGYTILVIQDAFSRCVFLRLLNNSSFIEVKNKLKEAYDFFKGVPKKFGTDRGIFLENTHTQRKIL